MYKLKTKKNCIYKKKMKIPKYMTIQNNNKLRLLLYKF